MKAKKFSLVFSALLCLLPTVCVPLSAQQPGPPISQRVTTAPPGAEARNSTPAQKLAQQCREFLASEEILQSRFEFTTDDELASIAKRAMRCGELPDVRLLRAAFVAYRIVRDEQDARIFRDSEVVSTTLLEMEQKESKKYEAQIEKQRADFAEAANFAVALYKQREQYHEARCTTVFPTPQREAGNLLRQNQAIHGAGRSRREGKPPIQKDSTSVTEGLTVQRFQAERRKTRKGAVPHLVQSVLRITLSTVYLTYTSL